MKNGQPGEERIGHLFQNHQTRPKDTISKTRTTMFSETPDVYSVLIFIPDFVQRDLYPPYHGDQSHKSHVH